MTEDVNHECPPLPPPEVEDTGPALEPEFDPNILNTSTGVTCPNCGDVEMNFNLNEDMKLVRECEDCGHKELVPPKP
jgi:DNA-directed RNA polymerase subunit RPC12/RpoP